MNPPIAQLRGFSSTLGSLPGPLNDSTPRDFGFIYSFPLVKDRVLASVASGKDASKWNPHQEVEPKGFYPRGFDEE